MKIEMVDQAGHYKTGVMIASLEQIEAILGPANCNDDPNKVTYSWGFTVDGVRCGIWDYYSSYKNNRWSTFGPIEALEKVFPGMVIRD